MQLRYLSLIAITLALQICGAAVAQDSAIDPAIVDAWKDNPQVRQCGLCHFAPGNDFAARETDFCRLIEAKLWLTNDNHAIARRRIEPLNTVADAAVADAASVSADAGSVRHGGTTQPNWIAPSNRLSYAIVSKLGYKIETEAGYAQFRDNCLSCHAGYQGQDEAHEFERDSTNRPGIACSFCHQVGNDTRWVDDHGGINAKQSWRALEPQSKAARGMRSLVAAEDQADLCLKCHVGDIQQNMFVTHQMYAAGHPPLPSVELGALLDAMPRHWRTNAELYTSLQNYRDRDLYFERTLGTTTDKNPQTIDQRNWQTQTIVTSAVAAYQQSLTVVAQAASPGSKRWGDYALYDCAACHHELRAPSSRQAARVGATPGRPRLAEWPQALSKAAITCLDEHATLEKIQAELHLAVGETPFGNRTKVAQQATAMNALLSNYRNQLSSEAVKPAFVKRYLMSLTQVPEVELIDYSTARQINWALRGIDAELARLKTPLPDHLRSRIAELGVRSGATEVSSQIPGSQSREIFPAFVDAELKRQASYDSKQFHAQLRSVRDAMQQ